MNKQNINNDTFINKNLSNDSNCNISTVPQSLLSSITNKGNEINTISYLKIIFELNQKINNIQDEIKNVNKRLDIIESNQNKQIENAINTFVNNTYSTYIKKIVKDIYEIKNTYKEDFEIKFLIDEKKFPKINKNDIEKNEGIPFDLKIVNIGKYAIPNTTKILCKSLNDTIFFYPIQFKESIIITLFSITNENNYENFDTNNYLIPGEIIQLTIKIFFNDNVEITSNKYSIKLDLESTENTIIKYNDIIIDVYVQNDDKNISSINKNNLLKENDSNINENLNVENNFDYNNSIRSELNINLKEGYNESFHSKKNINNSKYSLNNNKNLFPINSSTKNANTNNIPSNIFESENILKETIIKNNKVNNNNVNYFNNNNNYNYNNDNNININNINNININNNNN